MKTWSHCVVLYPALAHHSEICGDTHELDILTLIHTL